MNPCALTASMTAIANSLAYGLTEDEINLLGAVFTQLGDTLITLATHKSICKTAKPRLHRNALRRRRGFLWFAYATSFLGWMVAA